jgi:hypothetical protein
MHPYAQCNADGKLWRAGRTIYGLCAAWNHATNPSRLMTEEQLKRSNIYARAIRNRIMRMGYRDGTHYMTWHDYGHMQPKVIR